MRVRGSVQISSQKPLQIRMADHPQDIFVWPVAYLPRT
jgi:hypothetical protein